MNNIFFKNANLKKIVKCMYLVASDTFAIHLLNCGIS